MYNKYSISLFTQKLNRKLPETFSELILFILKNNNKMDINVSAQNLDFVSERKEERKSLLRLLSGKSPVNKLQCLVVTNGKFYE